MRPNWVRVSALGSSAVLATSVHLVCRPRAENAAVGDWADILKELPKRVGDWMERLQGEGVRGADLVFACIGPRSKSSAATPGLRPLRGAELHLPNTWKKFGRLWAEALLSKCSGPQRPRRAMVQPAL